MKLKHVFDVRNFDVPNPYFSTRCGFSKPGSPTRASPIRCLLDRYLGTLAEVNSDNPFFSLHQIKEFSTSLPPCPTLVSRNAGSRTFEHTGSRTIFASRKASDDDQQHHWTIRAGFLGSLDAMPSQDAPAPCFDSGNKAKKVK